MPAPVRAHTTVGTTVIPSISGIAALDFMRAMEDVASTAAFAKARERMPAEMLEQLDTITAMSWVSNETVNRLVDEVASASGIKPDRLLEQSIRAAVDHTFKTVWRVLLRLTTDDAMIKRTPMIYARGRNVGELNSRMLAPGRAEALLTGWPEIGERTVFTIGIGIQAVVELSGRKDVRMSHAKTADGARYELTWRV